MGYQDTAGIILYLIFHLAVSIRYIKEKPMPVSRWIMWGLFSLGADACIVLTCRNNPSVQDEWLFAAWCVPLLLLLLFSSIRQKPALRLSGILFFLSDALLAVCVYFLLNPVLHCAYTVLFSIAALILSLSVFSIKIKDGTAA